MSDALVWLRCLGCGAVCRVVAFGGGEWSFWHSVDVFIAQHMNETCHPQHKFRLEASEEGYTFFEMVGENSAKAREVFV